MIHTYCTASNGERMIREDIQSGTYLRAMVRGQGVSAMLQATIYKRNKGRKRKGKLRGGGVTASTCH